MEERCKRTDLYKSQCAHCRGIKTEVEEDRERIKIAEALSILPGWVHAVYRGHCGECGNPIEIGDAIKWAEDRNEKGILKTYWRSQCCATDKELKDAGLA